MAIERGRTRTKPIASKKATSLQDELFDKKLLK